MDKMLQKAGMTLWLAAVSLFVCADGAFPQIQEGSLANSAKGREGRHRLTVGSCTLWVQIAADPVSRARGLMKRTTLAPDGGMLFVFDSPAILSFWMRDTVLPLDIAFIGSDRRIVNILSMQPLDDKRLYRSSGPARYALEVNRGWFREHNVKPGDKVDF
jgi:uncharacterized protein